MQNIILVLICFFLGYFLKKSSRFPENSYKAINGFIIHISLPSLVLYHIHNISINSEVALASFMPWIVFIVSVIFFFLMYKLNFFNRETMAALVFTSGFGNTSFVGLPLIQAYYGSEYLGLAIIIDQVGTFLCLGTLGVAYLFYLKTGNFSLKSMGKMIIVFPPSQALIIALLLRGWEYPNWLNEILLRLGDTLTPLALFSVGLQLNLREIKNNTSYLILALGFKLIFAPFLIYLIYKAIGMDFDNLKIIVMEAAMAPMVTSSILAIEAGFRPNLCAIILGFGILLSFGTTFLVFLFLS